MASLNKVQLIGRLGQDVEMRALASGEEVANFSVATGDSWIDKKTGDKKESTEWHRIVAFGKLAELAASYLTKGSQVYVEGKIKTRSWDKDGEKRYATEIIAERVQFLDSKTASKPAEEEDDFAPTKLAKPAKTMSGGAFDDFADDIPFN